MEAVFGNELLLESILPYVIYGPRNEICRKNLCSMRLVQKLWLETVSRLIRKSCCDVYYVRVGNVNYISQECFGNKEIKLDLLTSTFSAENHLQISILPATLFMGGDYLVEENYNNILGLFTQCGQHLKTLHIQFGVCDKNPMPVRFPKFELPNLYALHFTFTNLPYFDDGMGTAFFETILKASSNLQKLEFNSVGEDQFDPINSQYVKLPEKITSLCVSGIMKSTIAELLLHNNLPVLQKLAFTLYEDDEDVSNLLVFKILEHFRKTLKYLHIMGGPRHIIEFPIMESLEAWQLFLAEFGIAPSSYILQNYMPKLKKIVLYEHIEDYINFLATNGLFTTVQEIHIVSSVDLKLMEGLHKILPNLQRVSMSVNEADTSAVKYIFGQMENLKTLEIEFFGEFKDDTDIQIGSVLLGLPSETVQPNLLNLSGLNWLHLTSERNLTNEESSLLTDFIFQQGLQKMLNLQTLLLSGRFKPTNEMLNAWKSQGRFMEYRKLVQGRNPFKAITI